MCDLILSHISSAIVDIDRHLLSNPPPRDLVVKLDPFLTIVTEPIEKESQGKGKGKGKGKGTTSAKAKGKAQDHMAKAGEFLSAVGCSQAAFVEEFKKIFPHMSKQRFDRHSRFETGDLSLRLLSMSGMRWNHSSQNKPRDWTIYAIAVSLETSLIRSYRKDLLDTCRGAQVLRRDIHQLMADLSEGHSLGKGKSITVLKQWGFPDGLQLYDTADTPDYEPEDLLEQWHEAAQGSLSKTKDDVQRLIETIEKSPYLAPSGSSANKGAIETLAHDLISGLMKIMYLNKARIEHARMLADEVFEEEPGPEFSPSTVNIPQFQRREHRTSDSERYRKELGYSNWVPIGAVAGSEGLEPPPPAQPSRPTRSAQKFPFHPSLSPPSSRRQSPQPPSPPNEAVQEQNDYQGPSAHFLPRLGELGLQAQETEDFPQGTDSSSSVDFSPSFLQDVAAAEDAAQYEHQQPSPSALLLSTVAPSCSSRSFKTLYCLLRRGPRRRSLLAPWAASIHGWLPQNRIPSPLSKGPLTLEGNFFTNLAPATPAALNHLAVPSGSPLMPVSLHLGQDLGLSP